MSCETLPWTAIPSGRVTVDGARCGGFVAGVGFIIYRFKVSFAHVYQSKAFKTQKIRMNTDQSHYPILSKLKRIVTV